MSLLGARAVSAAATQVGVREQPPGSNRGPEVDMYLRTVWIDATKGGKPWCAAFVCWCIEQATIGWTGEHRWRKSASVARLWLYNKQFEIEEPEEACVFIHLNDDGTGHTGFVTGLRDDGLLVTLEGNTDAKGSRTGGQVMAQQRERNYVQHYLRVG